MQKEGGVLQAGDWVEIHSLFSDPTQLNLTQYNGQYGILIERVSEGQDVKKFLKRWKVKTSKGAIELHPKNLKPVGKPFFIEEFQVGDIVTTTFKPVEN